VNILHLFGNGFDINLGMKTRYIDFYEYYIEKSTNSLVIENLRENIAKDQINWSDLEMAFGRYTSNFKNIEEFDKAYEDIVNSLCDYLDEEFLNYDFSKLNTDVFLKDLCVPEEFLSTQDIHEIFEYKNKWGQASKIINIINFNYTQTIEKILENREISSTIGTYHGSNHYLKEIIHIHGFTNDRTILGVNDLSQVSNLSFHDDSDFIEALIKIESNSRQRHNVDKQCEKLINSADLICVFGCSLGETDKFWWELIVHNLKRGVKVIIFFRAEEQNKRLAHKEIRIQRKVRELFLEFSDLTDDEKELYSNNIYVKINADIFKFFS